MKPNKRQRTREAGVISKCLGGQANPTGGGSVEQDRLDAVREQIIDTIRLQLPAAVTPDARRAAWSTVRDEIAARSPVAIERLERERGLSPGGV